MYKLFKFRTKIAGMAYFMILCLGFAACRPELDFKNVSVINPEDVWNNKALITGYLSDIYANSMPGWNFTANNNCDEAMSSNTPSISSYSRGLNITVSGTGVGFSYGNIDKINFMLEQLPTVSSTVLSSVENSQFQGQCLFWRAWHYWNSVKTVGGVPLIRKVQKVGDVNSLFVKRSPTSVCIDSIIDDLDKAIAVLPNKWSGADYGRIDKCAAMAIKGRILMWHASPLFNKTNDQARWQRAYDANKAAYDACKAAGYDLFPAYNQIWQTKGIANTEAIMYNSYYYPDRPYNMNTLMAPGMSSGNACQSMATAWQVLAFPRKDGTPMAIGTPEGVDTVRLRTDAAYNAAVFTDIVKNMDPRFYASVSVPGTPYPSTSLPAGQSLWTTFGYNSSGKLYEMVSIQTSGSPGSYYLYGQFYPLKAVTPGLDQTTSQQRGGNNFIELRFAEVLMNLAECANELNTGGHDYKEALTLLAALRQRGGVTKGAGTYGYGLDAYSSQASLRELMLRERLAEFCQEGKRWDDLRRLKRFDILIAEKYLSNIFFIYNKDLAPLTTKSDFDWTQNIQNDVVRAKFHLEFVRESTQNSVNIFNPPLNNWFYPIALNDWQKNFDSDPAMQNNEWGGTFDPLQ